VGSRRRPAPAFAPARPGTAQPAARADRSSGVPAVPAAPAAAPPAPPAAAAAFGPALETAERDARLLAGPGAGRGLIGPREVPRLWERHLLNCAAVAGLVPRPSRLVDLGSGAGLPGIVLAICLPDCQVTLLEPMLRRAAFLSECVASLGLTNAQVRRARAEDAAGQLAADVVTARAVAPLDRLAALAAGLLRPGGMVLAIKGDRASQEMAAAADSLRALGARDVQLVTAGSGRVVPATKVVRLTLGP
jgi:16S rRNA (guanine527-N7)-methyltransferase